MSASEHDRDALGAFALGGLDADEARRVGEHLAGCAECRAELAELNELKDLLDRYRKEAGRTTAGVIPVQVRFPQLGPAVFLAAELTAETRFPSLEIDYKRMGGR